ncbi:hypothetical protein HAX54_032975, partial [Datura stramonium]|nr:hypothetical protein [Datura stramonium]
HFVYLLGEVQSFFQNSSGDHDWIQRPVVPSNRSSFPSTRSSLEAKSFRPMTNDWSQRVV